MNTILEYENNSYKSIINTNHPVPALMNQPRFKFREFCDVRWWNSPAYVAAYFDN